MVDATFPGGKEKGIKATRPGGMTEIYLSLSGRRSSKPRWAGWPIMAGWGIPLRQFTVAKYLGKGIYSFLYVTDRIVKE